MAYKIRYGFDRKRPHSWRVVFRIQALVSGVLLALTVLLRFWEEGAAAAAQVLSDRTLTVTEQAVAAFADALAAGEGWYHGLMLWCRTVINAGWI